MQGRSPYLRLITDAGPVAAAAVAMVVLLGGILGGCRLGGAVGLMSVVVSAVAAWIAYIAVMAQVEAARLLLQIGDDLRARHTSRPDPDQHAN